MISLILAMDKSRVIGKDNRMPWHLPADLAYFKQLTLGHPVVMGRKTFESMGKPLPGRQNVIITKQEEYQIEGCIILHSIDKALDFCSGKDAFIIGGAKIYEAFLPHADKLYITLIEATFLGDSFFPKINNKSWNLVSKTQGERNDKNPYEYYFLVYEKR